LKKSIDLTPSYPAYANLGQLYYLEKRYVESASMTEKALQLNDNNYLVWNNLVNAYEWLKEKDKAATARARATELAEKSARLNPQDAWHKPNWRVFMPGRTCARKPWPEFKPPGFIPDDPAILDDVATAFEYLGNRHQSIQYAQRAVQKGYPLEQLANDPEMQSLLLDPSFHPRAK